MIIFRWLRTNANIERSQQTDTSLNFFQSAVLLVALHPLVVSAQLTLHTLLPHVHREAIKICTEQYSQTVSTPFSP